MLAMACLTLADAWRRQQQQVELKPLHPSRQLFTCTLRHPGRDDVLNPNRMVSLMPSVPQHTDGHFYAVNVMVTRVAGAGMDSSYMGVLEVSTAPGRVFGSQCIPTT